MHIFVRVIGVLFFITGITAQNYGRIATPEPTTGADEVQTMMALKEDAFAFEGEIDPSTYILGPGDELGLNILTSENLTYPLTVTPTGDLFIPSVGIIHVSGITMSDATIAVENYIHDQAYPGSKVNLVLLNVRKFKIQISGAVNSPGFVVINPTERLSDVVRRAEEFHQLAREFNIIITRRNGNQTTLNHLNYLRDGDLLYNPTFQEGDKIFVPFGDMKTEGIVLRGAVNGSGYDIIEPNEKLGPFLQRRAKFNSNADLKSVVITKNIDGVRSFINVAPQDFISTELMAGETVDILREKGVMVNGFVLTPGGFDYFPGSTAADYINLAGGNSENGNPNRCSVIHTDGSIEYGQGVVVQRGDVIVVPRTYKDIFIGTTSVLQIAVSVVTIYLTFLATGVG